MTARRPAPVELGEHCVTEELVAGAAPEQALDETQEVCPPTLGA